MAKIKIELDLRREVDLRDYNLFNNADNMYNALFEIAYNLKKVVDYKFDGDDNGYSYLVFFEISKILEDNNIDLDKL